MRWRTRLGAVLVAASVAVLPGATSAHAEENVPFNVWHWNVAGHTIHEGKTNTGVLEHAVTSILNREADLVSFNEVCRGQYNKLITLLDAANWPASSDFARFAATREPKPGICNGNEEFGHALFSRHNLGSSQQYELPYDGTAPRKLLCAPLEAMPHMKFCSVHITTGPREPGAPDNRPAQLNYMLDILNGFHAAGQTYIVAGDYNVQPHFTHLDRYYAPSLNTEVNRNNTGAHRELDDRDTRCPGYGEETSSVTPETAPPCGTATENLTKLDLIMARESKIVGSYTGDAVDVPKDCVVNVDKEACSDHRVTVGTVTLRVQTP